VYEIPMSFESWWPGTTAGAIAMSAVEGTDVAAEKFMRRLIGDARWDALPERTRATRRAEGAALVGELIDLRANRPWRAERITMPVMVGNGSRGAAHHQDGMARLAEMLGAQHAVLEGCRHDAPTSHPAEFCHRLVEPLLARVGAPWA